MNGIEKVTDLINEQQGTWKEDIINSTFTDLEARRILCIPLVGNGSVDKLQWCLEKSSEYTVRNRYQLLLRGFPSIASDLYNNIGFKRRQLYNKCSKLKCQKKLIQHGD